MRLFSVSQLSTASRCHVVALESERAAQGMARLLRAEFQGRTFKVEAGSGTAHPTCACEIRAFALSQSAQDRLAAEIEDGERP